MSTANWNFLGVLGGGLQELLVVIGNVMTRLGVSTEIIGWANTEKGRSAFGRAVEFFAREYESFLAEAKKLLKRVGTSTVTLTKDHNPDQFFRTRPGLWVSDDFRRLVVDKAQSSQAGVSFTISGDILTRNAKDTEIEAVLPQPHVFDETEVCAIIARLVVEQAEGQEGLLLNNGFANLFYTSSRVVLVRWHADYREWFVSTWNRGGSVWSAGDRVFSPATAA